jgi:hypothetical protein
VIDLKGDFQANPHSVNWRIDGDLQPATTYSEGGKNVTSLVFGTGSTVEFFTANYDDIYASQTVANYPLGDGKVLALRPNTMGTSNGSGNFQDDDGTAIDATTYTRVGEVPASSTSDYVKQTANSGTSYVEVGFENPAEICIDGVGARIAFHSPSAAGNDGEVRVLDGTTSTVVYNGDMGQTSLGYARAVVTPASTWSQSAVSGLVARLGYSGDTSPNPYFDSVLLEYDMPTPQ